MTEGAGVPAGAVGLEVDPATGRISLIAGAGGFLTVRVDLEPDQARALGQNMVAEAEKARPVLGLTLPNGGRPS